jgi:hypothetical protein
MAAVEGSWLFVHLSVRCWLFIFHRVSVLFCIFICSCSDPTFPHFLPATYPASPSAII